MARNRIIYASQSVWANGNVLYRVQSFGSTTTFSSEDIFEFGHLDIIDIVDDVPSVAITLNTNDFGDVKTMAILAQVSEVKLLMEVTATNTNANLAVVSGTGLTETGVYLHGACLADFAVQCGNLPGVTMWAPVQEECSLGTLDESIDQTLFMDDVFVNSLEFAYSTGANATENYGAETDQKMWLLNDGRFVSYDSYTFDSTDVANDYVDLTLAGSADVTTLSAGIGFLRKDPNGEPAVTVWIAATNTMTNWPVNTTGATATHFYIDNSDPNRLTFPTGNPFVATDKLFAVYCSTEYASSATSTYFTALNDSHRSDNVGAIRQGQVEIYLVSDTDADFDIAWRLTSCTVSADLTREPLTELGHLGPYDRPVTLPIPITVTVDSTAGDLENWAKVANRSAAFDADTMFDIDLADLMSYEDLKLVIKIYAQTDEEAGGTADNRTVATGSKLVGQYYQEDGVVAGPYSAGNQERALKTLVIEHLKITDEGSTLDVGSNATQTFGFRSTNDLYVVKGDLKIDKITDDNKIRRNA